MMGFREPGHEQAAVPRGRRRGGPGGAASGGGVQRRFRIGRASSSHLAAVAHGGGIAAVPGGGEHAPGHVRVADQRPRRGRRDRGIRGPAERPARAGLPAVRVDHGAVVPGRRVPVRLVLRSPGPPGLGVGPGPRAAPDGGAHRGGHPHGHRPVAAVADGRHPELAARFLSAAPGRRQRGRAVRAGHGPVGEHRGGGGHPQRQHHLAGVQRLGRLQPLPGAGRAAARPGLRGELRPPLRSERRGPVPVLRPEGDRAGRADRGPARLRNRRRPRPAPGPAGRSPRGHLPRPRRVLLAGDAERARPGQGRRDQPGLPRRERDLPARQVRRRGSGRHLLQGRYPRPAVRQGQRADHAAVAGPAGSAAGERDHRGVLRVQPGERRRTSSTPRRAGSSPAPGLPRRALPRPGGTRVRPAQPGRAVPAAAGDPRPFPADLRRLFHLRRFRVLHRRQRRGGVRVRHDALGVRHAGAVLRARREPGRRAVRRPGHAEPAPGLRGRSRRPVPAGAG